MPFTQNLVIHRIPRSNAGDSRGEVPRHHKTSSSKPAEGPLRVPGQETVERLQRSKRTRVPPESVNRFQAEEERCLKRYPCILALDRIVRRLKHNGRQGKLGWIHGTRFPCPLRFLRRRAAHRRTLHAHRTIGPVRASNGILDSRRSRGLVEETMHATRAPLF